MDTQQWVDIINQGGLCALHGADENKGEVIIFNDDHPERGFLRLMPDGSFFFAANGSNSWVDAEEAEALALINMLSGTGR